MNTLYWKIIFFQNLFTLLFNGIVSIDTIFIIFIQFVKLISVRSYVGWCFALKGQCHKIFCFRFFHESSFPKPLRIKLGPFLFFSKIPKDIRSINDTVNFPTSTAGVVDTGGKFAEVGGPQISSANSISVNLKTYKICNISGRSASVAICDLRTQYFLRFADMRFVDPNFLRT